MLAQDIGYDSLLEIRVQKMSRKTHLSRKLIIVDINALIELYLATISSVASVCNNTLQNVHKRG